MIGPFARKFAASLLALTALSLTSPALAQRGAGAGGGGSGPMGQPTMASPGGSMQQDRIRTPDQIRDKDRIRDPDRDRDRDRLRDPDATRDRDRLHVDQVVDGQLSSWRLLTGTERQKFFSEMHSASSQQDRDRIRAEHQAIIQERAHDLGVDAPFGPQRAGSGTRGGYNLVQMLSDQERLQFHQRMREAGSAEERERIRNEMRITTRERAIEMGVDVPSWYGNRGPDE